MNVLTKKQRDFLNTLVSFKWKSWFLSSVEKYDTESELDIVKRCISFGKYSKKDSVVLNSIVRYFKRAHHLKLVKEEDKEHFRKYI